MACFVQNDAISSILIPKRKKKDKAQNGVILDGTVHLLLPLDVL
jgi:hypothetical protein